MGNVDRIAHIHVMKTAGTYVNSYMIRNVCKPRGYDLHVSWEAGIDRDWTTEELHHILDLEHTKSYLHNHVGHWPEDVFRRLQDDDWFTFAFLRNPADQWCSYYFWAKRFDANFTRRISLEELLQRAFDPTKSLGGELVSNMDPPVYWRELDYIAEFTDESFGWFLDHYFDISYAPAPRANASANRGYDYYRSEGIVDDRTNDIVLSSDRYQTFEEIRRRAAVTTV